MGAGKRFLFFLFLCLMPCFYSHLFLTGFSYRILQGLPEKRATAIFHVATVIRSSCLSELPVVVCAVRQNTLLGKLQFGSGLRWQYFLVGSRSGCQPRTPQISTGNDYIPTCLSALLAIDEWRVSAVGVGEWGGGSGGFEALKSWEKVQEKVYETELDFISGAGSALWSCMFCV